MEHKWNEGDLVDRYNSELAPQTRELEELISLLELRQSDVLLDLGCGNGDFLRMTAPRVRRSIGVDVSSEQLRRAQEKGPLAHVSWMESSFETLSLPSGDISRALARKSLHHLDEREKANFFFRARDWFTSDAVWIIEDAIFPFSLHSWEDHMPEIIEEAKRHFGDRFETSKDLFLETLNDEFPTDEHHLATYLISAGFNRIEWKRRNIFLCTVIARKGE